MHGKQQWGEGFFFAKKYFFFFLSYDLKTTTDTEDCKKEKNHNLKTTKDTEDYKKGEVIYS